MTNAGMEFADRFGVEPFELLRQRVLEQLASEKNFDSYAAVLGAALIVAANVLRGPVEKGGDPEALVAFASRWLRSFRNQIRTQTKEVNRRLMKTTFNLSVVDFSASARRLGAGAKYNRKSSSPDPCHELTRRADAFNRT